jgi:hypothetical protein
MKRDEIIREALSDICAARLCEVNSMSSRQEMLRLMIQATDALRAALEQEEQEEPAAKPLTVIELRQALVNVDLVDADAIDDPDGYDAGTTVSRIDALYEWLKEKNRE